MLMIKTDAYCIFLIVINRRPTQSLSNNMMLYGEQSKKVDSMCQTDKILLAKQDYCLPVYNDHWL